MEMAKCSCHLVDTECYADSCPQCNPSCPLCDDKLARENAVLKAEIRGLKASTNKKRKELGALAEDLEVGEMACDEMEQELANLLQGKRRGQRRSRANAANKK